MTAMRRLFCGLAMVGACAVFGACQGLPPMPQAAPVASPGGTWVGQGQVFVFCPGGKMLVLDPSMQVTWCRGTHGADGRFSAETEIAWATTYSLIARTMMSGARAAHAGATPLHPLAGGPAAA